MMTKEEMDYDTGKMMVVAAVLLTIGMLGGSYILAGGDYAPKINITGGPSNPTVYVSSTPPDHVISVSATASKKVAPDLLNIQLSVQTEASNAKDAQDENAKVAADLLTKLKALGIKDEEMQTVSYSVDPVYDSEYVCDSSGTRCQYRSKLVGYKATHGLNVKITDLTKGGDVIDAAGTAGKNQTFVDYVTFGLQDETRRSLETELLQDAGDSARAKADGIAAGLNVSVGKVLSASESFNYPTPVYYKGMYAAADAAPAPPTQLSPGQVDVTATISASFEIGS